MRSKDSIRSLLNNSKRGRSGSEGLRPPRRCLKMVSGSVKNGNSPAPIAKLMWVRESTYLRDEPCHVSELTIEGDVAAVHPQQVPETCAVIETTATLRQRSSAKDATPEDYKLHQLLTSGTASGGNKTLLFVSTQTGLLVRSSDHADQKMSVTISKADNSNRVHYDIHAKSDTEIFRIANSPLNTSASSSTNPSN